MKQTILFFTLILLVSACGQRPASVERQTPTVERSDSPGQQETTTATREQLNQPGTTILADGQLVSTTPATFLTFNVAGRLSEIHVKAGDKVEAGELLATVDDQALTASITNAELQVAQAEASLALAELNLQELISWKPDELAVNVAEANLAVAEANHEAALEQDSVATNSLTSARVAVDQAKRSVADAQDAYDTAWDPARDWELGDPWRKQALENERDATTRAVQYAEESLAVAQANYNLTLAGLATNTALNAEASVASAQQALDLAQTGPGESELEQARLQVETAKISLDQAEFALSQARSAQDDASLIAPWPATVLSVDSAVGTVVSPGTPILTLLDSENLVFETKNLSERDLVAVLPGQLAEITLKSYPGQVVRGKVDRISPQASGLIGDAATFTAVIKLDPVELMLLAGMTGRVEITPAENS